MSKFIGVKNRDSGVTEYLAIDRIYRVMPCPNPEHMGYPLVWMDIFDLEGNALVIEVDADMDEFMEALRLMTE